MGFGYRIMAISILPIKTSQFGASYSITAPAANVAYRVIFSFSNGTYKIDGPSDRITRVSFWNNSTLIGTAQTTSGTVSFNLGTTATDITYWTTSGTNTVITITKTGEPLASGVSGTLDVIATSGTYNQTGQAYVFAVGGGMNGLSGWSNDGGAGGSSGRLSNVELVNLTNSVPVTVTVGGVGGGNSAFGNFVNTTNGALAPGGAQNASGSATPAGAGLPVINGTTGGGGGGGSITGAGPFPGGGDGGIGTGGTGSAFPGNGGGGTGYGSGGGGGSRSGSNNFQYGGGAGRPGAVFVLRF